MKFAGIESFLVVVHDEMTPTDLEWSDYLDALHKAAPSGVFVYSGGGGPNAVQRRKLQAVLKAIGGTRVAVLTPGVVARTIVSALNLFSPQPMAVFAPDEVVEALEHIGAGGVTAEKIVGRATRMAQSLGVSTEHLEAA